MKDKIYIKQSASSPPMLAFVVSSTKKNLFLIRLFVVAAATLAFSHLADAAPTFSTPFLYVPYGSTSNIEISKDDVFLGEGSIKGSIPIDSTDRFDKIIVTFVSENYIDGTSNELWNRPVGDLEYIEYSYKVDACHGANTACPEQFYLNVYTRSEASVTDYYSCRYDLLPSVGGNEGGAWTTIRFDLSSIAADAVSRPNTAGCPAGDKTLQNAADSAYVLGTNIQSVSPDSAHIFSLNMGDTALTDNGLIGYFDKIVIKLVDEVDAREFDLGEPHYVDATVGNDSNDGSILSPFRSIQAAINASLAHQTIYVDPGTYEELISIEKPLSLIGPNTGIAGYDVGRNPEAVITYPEGITDIKVALVTVAADNVTIDGFDIRYKEYLIGLYPYTVYSFQVNNMSIQNNIIYGSDRQLYVVTKNDRTVYREGLLVENNFFDGGPFVNSKNHRAMYIQSTAGVIQDNVIVNASKGIQYMPYLHTTSGIIQRNTISASEIGLYHNFQDIGAAPVYWLENDVYIAPNDQQGLKTSLYEPWGAPVTFRGIHVITFGRQGTTGVDPTVSFTRNSIHGELDPNQSYNLDSREAVRVSTAEKGEIILLENSFEDYSVGVNVVDDCITCNIFVDALCNWWGVNVPSNITQSVANGVRFLPLLLDGTDADNDAAGFQPLSSACSWPKETTTFEYFFNTGASINYQGIGTTTLTANGYTIPDPYGSLWTVADEWGFMKTSPPAFDEEVVDDGTGNKVWRVSNSVTGGSFSNLPWSPSSPSVAGESTAGLWNDRGPIHSSPLNPPNVRSMAETPFFHASLKFKSAVSSPQSGLSLTLSAGPRQSSIRLSWLSISDNGVSGLDIGFYDTNATGSFIFSSVATDLSYTDWHELDIYITFVEGLNDGAGNDVVTILLNDTIVHSGTTWETYYHLTPGTFPNSPYAVDALLFRLSGTAIPDNAGNGFYFDDITIDNEDRPSDEPSTEPSRKPTRKPTRRPTRSPTRSPSHSPSKAPTTSPTKSPTKQPTQKPTLPPVPPKVNYLQNNICGTCDVALVSRTFEQEYNNVGLKGQARVIATSGNCDLCFTGLSGLSRVASQSVSVIIEVVQNPTPEEPDDFLEPSEVINFFNSKAEVISAAVSQQVGIDIVMQNDVREIEAPSSRPSQSPAPSISQLPSISLSPTQRFQPSTSPTSSPRPSSSPTTRSSRTFQIISSFNFDDSGRDFCLNAMRFKVGRRAKMRPCRDGFRKQMWFLDDFDQLRLRERPDFCLTYRKREISLGKCKDDERTERARFRYDKARGVVYVRKRKRDLYLGVEPGENKYGPVRLFLEGQNESLTSWFLF